MKRLRIATVVMSATALAVIAVLVAWSVGPMAANALSNQIGEMAVAHNNAQLARDFDKIYPQYRARLPVQLDDRTTLIDLSYRGHVFRLRHLVESENTRTTAIAVGERTRKTMLAKVCADEDMRATMKRGAIYEFQYLDRQSRLLGSFDIRNADCDT